MSEILQAAVFPLHGSRLIEASAGTGKTWTIAALYLRLVLGHGGETAFIRPLQPAEILVMTFTRAATRELSDRIRSRLIEAAQVFRGDAQASDPFLAGLLEDYADQSAREQAAYRLAMAAEAMDDSAVFTIDAWCQRMLREHAFDSGSLFDEELNADETGWREQASKDYWRQQVYPLGADHFARVQSVWGSVYVLEEKIRAMLPHARRYEHWQNRSLTDCLQFADQEALKAATQIKSEWKTLLEELGSWYQDNCDALNGNKLRAASVEGFFTDVFDWLTDPQRALLSGKAIEYLDKWESSHLDTCWKKGKEGSLPRIADSIADLQKALTAIPTAKPVLYEHAAAGISHRMAMLKQQAREFGFADMLQRLRAALQGDNAAQLAARIRQQFPVALIDEFQDTSPDQYMIFDALYAIAENRSDTGVFLIGDPKQAIYGFRGADIRSYLTARSATAGRHYVLDTNFRSVAAVVDAVNHVFMLAENPESGQSGGAFCFRRGDDNPLPFEPVKAKGRAEKLVRGEAEIPGLQWMLPQNTELKEADFRRELVQQCAEQMVQLLNDAECGFRSDNAFRSLRPADMAVLVRNRYEAAEIRAALSQRGVASVYLSDKDSIFQTPQARDVLYWLQAVADPLAAGKARAALATRSACRHWDELQRYAEDDYAWEQQAEQLRQWQQIWRRQGVLAMIRQMIHGLSLGSRLLNEQDGERRLTDLLHLAELLQQASVQLEGEQALIRWLEEQIHDPGEADEHVLRLESDAELVQVITIHKSKGLEYPLVFLPFIAAGMRKSPDAKAAFYQLPEEGGQTRLDFAKSKESSLRLRLLKLEEDLRLLYVALTRPRHAMWLGMADVEDQFRYSGLAYLLGLYGDDQQASLTERLQAVTADCGAMQILPLPEQAEKTHWQPRSSPPPVYPASDYTARFEKDWAVVSYSSITRGLGESVRTPLPLLDKLAERDDSVPDASPVSQVWHAFPRGPVPGQFLHEQLEWLAGEGFHVTTQAWFADAVRARCERAGWAHRQEDVIVWLQQIAQTTVPYWEVPLAETGQCVPEMEFWFPADAFSVAELDSLSQQTVWPELARPALADSAVKGMLRGFMDLVVEHDGRYWVMDYKSNALGSNDDAYRESALQQAMLQHRYEVQGMLYLLALHRLLKLRLGEDYDPQQHLGGAVFYFLRGVANPGTAGCVQLAPDPVWMDQLEMMLSCANEEMV
ncbi:exodeoxyribonuclease V subunit beta [Undibacterium luofuense]|uniref:RecBCD enzyme subunit RecB n=1 Tax=Undibacterium luofuense TaxID=2828733 RepID=A0A941DL02_9BURK|nr:exodeoxyribonuclease V subunit beta [Undibacterium luofuense]MBR7782733.1 exodeoxyribonuclease V subunit beta [Undibacterium luofuense]